MAPGPWGMRISLCGGAGQEGRVESMEKRHSRSTSAGRMSWKRLKHLLGDFPAVTCILAAPFPGISPRPAPEVTQISRGCLCPLSTLGEAVPSSGVALPPRQRWMAQHKLSPPKQSLRWTSPEFRAAHWNFNVSSEMQLQPLCFVVCSGSGIFWYF